MSDRKNEIDDDMEPYDTATFARDAVRNLASASELDAFERDTLEEEFSDDDNDDFQYISVEKEGLLEADVTAPVPVDYSEYVESIRPRARTRPDYKSSPSYKNNRTYSSVEEDSEREMYVTTALEQLENLHGNREVATRGLDLERYKFILLAVSVAVLLIFAFLITRINKISAALVVAESVIDDNESMITSSTTLMIDKVSMEEEIESLKLENTKLKAINRQYMAGLDPLAPIDTTNAGQENPENTTGQTTNPGTTSGSKTHTVKAGDDFWKIAKQYYNEGSRYLEIMELNGYTEATAGKLQIGDVLNLP